MTELLTETRADERDPQTEELTPIGSEGGAETRMPWYAATLCKVGLHRGTWEFAAPGNCTQTKTCERCGTTNVRTKHRHEWLYKGERTCAQAKTCIRCAAVSRSRTHHEEWGDAYDAGRDESGHRCLRCGTVETWSTASDD